MTAYALITGVIFRAPVQKIAKSGRPFTSCTLKVGSDDSGASDFWNVLSFSESSQLELLRLEAGDAVSIRGKFKIETYEKDGQTRISRSIFADAAIGLRPAPRTKAKAATKAPTAQGQTTTSAPDPDLNDDLSDLPF